MHQERFVYFCWINNKFNYILLAINTSSTYLQFHQYVFYFFAIPSIRLCNSINTSSTSLQFDQYVFYFFVIRSTRLLPLCNSINTSSPSLQFHQYVFYFFAIPSKRVDLADKLQHCTIVTRPRYSSACQMHTSPLDKYF